MGRVLPVDWRNIKLSKHFTLGEFVVSRDHPEIASRIVPTVQQVDNFYMMCLFALDQIRAAHGPLIITSGLANKELNIARGSKIMDSQHEKGEAVDFITPHTAPIKVYLWCQSYLKWPGELIYYPKRGHIHLAMPSIFVKPDRYVDES